MCNVSNWVCACLFVLECFWSQAPSLHDLTIILVLSEACDPFICLANFRFIWLLIHLKTLQLERFNSIPRIIMNKLMLDVDMVYKT